VGSIADLVTTTPVYATLGTPCAVTKGQVFAVVVIWTSAVGDIRIEWIGRRSQVAFPYLREFNGASWVKHEGTATVFVEFSGANRMANNNVAGTYSDGSPTSVSETVEVASKITMPFTCRVIGCAVCSIIEGSGGPSDLDITTDMEIVLYDNDDTVLASARGFGATYRHVARGMLLLYFDTSVASSVIVTAGSTYRFAVKLYDHVEPDPGVTLSGYRSGVGVGEAVGMGFATFRTNYIASQRSSGGGAWTDLADVRTCIIPILDQIGI
jgi:hypothetical protein